MKNTERKLAVPRRNDDAGEIRIYNGKRYFSRNPQAFDNVFAMEVMDAGEEQSENGISIPRKTWNNLSKGARS